MSAIAGQTAGPNGLKFFIGTQAKNNLNIFFVFFEIVFPVKLKKVKGYKTFHFLWLKEKSPFFSGFHGASEVLALIIEFYSLTFLQYFPMKFKGENTWFSFLLL